MKKICSVYEEEDAESFSLRCIPEESYDEAEIIGSLIYLLVDLLGKENLIELIRKYPNEKESKIWM